MQCWMSLIHLLKEGLLVSLNRQLFQKVIIYLCFSNSLIRFQVWLMCIQLPLFTTLITRNGFPVVVIYNLIELSIGLQKSYPLSEQNQREAGLLWITYTNNWTCSWWLETCYFDLLEGSKGSYDFTGSWSCAIPYVEQTRGKICSLICILYCVNFLSVNEKSAGTGSEDEKRYASKNTKAWICCSISVGFSVEAVFAEGERKYICWANIIHLHT